MIQDKNFQLRLIRQLAEMLQKLIMDNPDEELMKTNWNLDSRLKDIFNIDFENLAKLSTEDLVEKIKEREKSQQVLCFELLAHLFFLVEKNGLNKAYLERSKYFYNLFLRESSIFSFSIMKRLSEMETLLKD